MELLEEISVGEVLLVPQDVPEKVIVGEEEVDIDKEVEGRKVDDIDWETLGDRVYELLGEFVRVAPRDIVR